MEISNGLNPYTKLAFEAIKNYLENNKIIGAPQDLPREFYARRAGAFVTLYQKTPLGEKELRGCIGTYLPQRENLAQEIIHNAISAAAQDYRFPALTLSELGDISIEVSILSAPEQVLSPKSLDAKKYGVIAKTTDGRCGLLLPNIPSIKNVNEQISVACQKGGIDSANDDLILHRFSVEKHED